MAIISEGLFKTFHTPLFSYGDDGLFQKNAINLEFRIVDRSQRWDCRRNLASQCVRLNEPRSFGKLPKQSAIQASPVGSSH